MGLNQNKKLNSHKELVVVQVSNNKRETTEKDELGHFKYVIKKIMCKHHMPI